MWHRRQRRGTSSDIIVRLQSVCQEDTLFAAAGEVGEIVSVRELGCGYVPGDLHCAFGLEPADSYQPDFGQAAVAHHHVPDTVRIHLNGDHHRLDVGPIHQDATRWLTWDPRELSSPESGRGENCSSACVGAGPSLDWQSGPLARGLPVQDARKNHKSIGTTDPVGFGKDITVDAADGDHHRHRNLMM
jgi:hypothetical protein